MKKLPILKDSVWLHLEDMPELQVLSISYVDLDHGFYRKVIKLLYWMYVLLTSILIWKKLIKPSKDAGI